MPARLSAGKKPRVIRFEWLMGFPSRFGNEDIPLNFGRLIPTYAG
jgi:hypothetical protein